MSSCDCQLSDCQFSDTEREIDSDAFPPSITSPASSKPLFLSGAGFKGLDIEGRFEFCNCNVVGVYLDSVAVPSLSVNWKGKTADELTESDLFYREIITGQFEKFIKVRMKLPLTGQHYSEELTENYVANWKSSGIYTEAEDKAVERFLELFKDYINFPPYSSILFAVSPDGSTLTVAFSKDNSIPETGSAKIENKLLAEAVLESIIGENGFSPEARQSLAKRLAKLMNTVEEDATRTDQEEATDLSLGDKLAKEN